MTRVDDDPRRPAAAEPAAPEAEDAEAGPAEPSGVHGLADVTLAPVRVAMHGRSRWLRLALLAHLFSTFAATLAAWHLGLEDWQLYAWMGLASAVLVGNFMRRHRHAGVLRRVLGTAAALVVCLAWTALLADRALGPLESRNRVIPDAQLFWVPVALLLTCSALLALHLVTSGGRDRHRIP